MAGDVRCVWIATLSSRSLLGSTRKSTGSAKDARDLCLTDRLHSDFQQAVFGTPFEQLDPSNCHILGALAISPSERYLHRESRVLGEDVMHQLSHWTTLAGRPMHGFALLFKVHSAVLLREPVSWFTFSGRRGGCFFSELEGGQRQRLIAAWPEGNQHHLFSYPFMQVLRLPTPFAMFLLKGPWTTVVVPDLPVPWNHDAYGVSKGRRFVAGLTGNGRKRQYEWQALRRFGKRPALQEAEVARTAGLSKQVDSVHDPAKLWGLADCVAALGHGENQIDPEIWKDFIEGMRYQQAESLLLSSKRHHYVSGGRGSFAFRIGHLVETMLCAMCLSNDSDLPQALKLAACLLLPEKIAHEWVRRLSEDPGLYLPSKAIISQRRAALDMGYACCQQAWVAERLAEGVFFYALTDSSPQGGRDYEVTVLDAVNANDAIELLMFSRHARGCLDNSQLRG